MKYILLIACFSFYACNSENADEKIEITPLQKTSSIKTVGTAAPTYSENFDDLKAKDEAGCETEEEIQKKLEEEMKKAQTQPVKLQGAEPDCAVQ